MPLTEPADTRQMREHVLPGVSTSTGRVVSHSCVTTGKVGVKKITLTIELLICTES